MNQKSKVYLVEWTSLVDAPHLQLEHRRVNCRRVFGTDDDADAFIRKLYDAASLLGTEVYPHVSELEVSNGSEIE